MTHEEKPPQKLTEMEIDNAVNCLKEIIKNYTKPASVSAEEILSEFEDYGSIPDAVCSAKTLINTHMGIIVNLYAVTCLEGRK